MRVKAAAWVQKGLLEELEVDFCSRYLSCLLVDKPVDETEVELDALISQLEREK